MWLWQDRSTTVVSCVSTMNDYIVSSVSLQTGVASPLQKTKFITVWLY